MISLISGFILFAVFSNCVTALSPSLNKCQLGLLQGVQPVFQGCSVLANPGKKMDCKQKPGVSIWEDQQEFLVDGLTMTASVNAQTAVKDPNFWPFIASCWGFKRFTQLSNTFQLHLTTFFTNLGASASTFIDSGLSDTNADLFVIAFTIPDSSSPTKSRMYIYLIDPAYENVFDNFALDFHMAKYIRAAFNQFIVDDPSLKIFRAQPPAGSTNEAVVAITSVDKKLELVATLTTQTVKGKSMPAMKVVINSTPGNTGIQEKYYHIVENLNVSNVCYLYLGFVIFQNPKSVQRTKSDYKCATAQFFPKPNPGSVSGVVIMPDSVRLNI